MLPVKQWISQINGRLFIIHTNTLAGNLLTAITPLIISTELGKSRGKRDKPHFIPLLQPFDSPLLCIVTEPPLLLRLFADNSSDTKIK